MPGRPSEGGSSGTDIDCFVEVNVKVKRIHWGDLTCSIVENVSGIDSMRQPVGKSNVALLSVGRPRIGCGCVLAVHIANKVYHYSTNQAWQTGTPSSATQFW
jgi:hypothetical protein